MQNIHSATKDFEAAQRAEREAFIQVVKIRILIFEGIGANPQLLTQLPANLEEFNMYFMS